MNRIRSSGIPGKTQMAWKIENQADSDVDIFLYDVVGDFGVTASDFVRELKGIGNRPINLHVNSEGGDVFDALAIYAALKAHRAPVTAYVDSLAASAAAFIVMAADKIVISKTASMMIHEAHAISIGNSEDMLKAAALLEDTTKNIAEIYADHTDVPVKSWQKAMKAETWYHGEEAVKAGLADEVLAIEPKNLTTTEITAVGSEEKEEITHPAIDYAALFEKVAEEENTFNV